MSVMSPKETRRRRYTSRIVNRVFRKEENRLAILIQEAPDLAMREELNTSLATVMPTVD